MHMDWDKLKVFHAAAEARQLYPCGRAAWPVAVGGLAAGVGARAGARRLAVPPSRARPDPHRTGRAAASHRARRVHEARGGARQADRQPASARTAISRCRPPPGIGIHWLTPRLGEFLDLYPDIRMTLLTTDEELDLADARGRRRHPPAAADAARPDPAQAVLGALPRLCVAGIPQALRHAADARGSRQASHHPARRQPCRRHLQQPQLADRSRP